MAAVPLVGLDPLARLEEVTQHFVKYFNVGILTGRVRPLDPHKVPREDVHPQRIAQGGLPRILMGRKGVPLRRLLPLPSPVGCCLSRVPIYPSITMSQSRFLQEEYSKKIHQAANKAAINVAIADLVAARKVCHADGGKRLIKSSHSYDCDCINAVGWG